MIFQVSRLPWMQDRDKFGLSCLHYFTVGTEVGFSLLSGFR